MMGGDDVADMTNADVYTTIVATTTERVRELPIKDGQIIFARDEKYGFHRIAMDFKGNRTFYNQITVLESEYERLAIDSPTIGYYFVIGSGIFWRYEDDWIQITEKPENTLFIGVELPELGQAKEDVLYVNKVEREIAVFDSASNEYIVVSDYTREVTSDDINNLFK